MTEPLSTLLVHVVPEDQLAAVASARALLAASNADPAGDSFRISDHTAATKVPALATLLERYDFSFTTGAPAVPSVPLPACPSGSTRVSLDQRTCVARSRDVGHEFVAALGRAFGDERSPLRHGRSYPSAGGLYLVQVMVVPLRRSGGLEPFTVYHLRPALGLLDPIADTSEAALRQIIAPTAACDPLQALALVAYVVVPAAACAKYGPRGYRLSLFEIGAATQALADEAGDDGLATRPWSAFDELGAAAVFGLSPQSAWVELLQVIDAAPISAEDPT